jgi:hypothetical protein
MKSGGTQDADQLHLMDAASRESVRHLVENLIHAGVSTGMSQWHMWSNAVDLELSERCCSRNQIGRTIQFGGEKWIIVLHDAPLKDSPISIADRQRSRRSLTRRHLGQ